MEGIISASRSATTKNGNPYVVVTLLNKDSNSTVNVWGAKTEDLPIGKLFRGNVKESDGFISCTLRDFRIEEPTEEYSNLLPKAVPFESWSKLKNEIVDKLDSAIEQKFILNKFDSLYNLYVSATAARSFHHNFIGGLLQHTYELLNIFIHIKDALPYKVDTFVVAVACLYHDYGKLNEYTSNFDYTEDFFLLGHPFMSATKVAEDLKEYGFNAHVVKHIQHCVLAHHGKLEFGASVLPASPEAYLVSMLDGLSGVGVQYDVPTGTKARSTEIIRY